MRLLVGWLLLAACSDEPASTPAERGTVETSAATGLTFQVPQVYGVALGDDWATSLAPSGPVVVTRSADGRSQVTPLFPGGEPYDGPSMEPWEEEPLTFEGAGDPSVFVLPREVGANRLWEVTDTELVPQADVLPADWSDRYDEGARAGDTLYVSEGRDAVAVDLRTGVETSVPLLEDPTVLWIAAGHGLLVVQTGNYLQVVDPEGELRWVLPNAYRSRMVALDEGTLLYGDLVNHELVLLDLEPAGFARELGRFPWPKMGPLMDLVASPGGASLVAVLPEDGEAVVIPVTWAPTG